MQPRCIEAKAEAALVTVLAGERLPCRCARAIGRCAHAIFVQRANCRSLVTSAAAFAIIAHVELGVFGPHFESAFGAKPIDLNIGRTYPPLIFEYIRGYGAAGRGVYLSGFVPLDTLFPLLGGVFLALCIGWLSKHCKQSAADWRLIAVPLASCALDWTENVFFVTIVLAHPMECGSFAWMGYGVSLSKLGTLAASFAIVLWLVLLALIRPNLQSPWRADQVVGK